MLSDRWCQPQGLVSYVDGVLCVGKSYINRSINQLQDTKVMRITQLRTVASDAVVSSMSSIGWRWRARWTSGGNTTLLVYLALSIRFHSKATDAPGPVPRLCCWLSSAMMIPREDDGPEEACRKVVVRRLERRGTGALNKAKIMYLC